MRTWTKGVLALAVMAMAASPSLAQRPGGPGGAGGRGMGMGAMGMGIVGMPPVQQELGIKPDQAGKVESIVGEMRDAMQSLRERLQDVAPGERMERMRELMSEANEKVESQLAEVLDENQMKRLKQIELQMRGVQAFADAKVQEALTMTAEQKAKVQDLLADFGERQRSIMQEAQGDFAGAMGKVRELRDEIMGKAKELMSEDQIKAWGEMIGEAFEMPAFGPGRPGGGPGGGRRGGPPGN